MSSDDLQLRLALSLFHCKGGHAPALSRALRHQGSLKALMATTREAQEQYGLSLSQQALLSGEPASAESLALGDKDPLFIAASITNTPTLNPLISRLRRGKL